MTENMKKFLEKVSADAALVEKFANMDKNAVIALAKELGFELTNDDLKQPAAQELDENELDTVAGGATCMCTLGGGGKKESVKNTSKVCACVQAGAGDFTSGDCRCWCVLAGWGLDEE